MKPVISIIQIILGILLIMVILLQQKGSGLGTAFGGDFAFYRTKRGTERLLFIITIALSTIFISLSIIGLIV